MKKCLLFIFAPILIIYFFTSCSDEPVDLDYGPFNYGKVRSILSNGYVVIRLESGNGNVVSHSKGMQITSTGSGLILNGGGEITIGVDNISMQLNGGSVVNSSTPGNLVAHNITISGNSSDVSLERLDLDSTINVNIQNTGQYIFKGRCGYLQVTNTNLGKFFGFELETDSCYVINYAVNQIQVNTTQKFSGVIMGTGSVFYKGNPPIVNTSAIGSGQFIPY